MNHDSYRVERNLIAAGESLCLRFLRKVSLPKFHGEKSCLCVCVLDMTIPYFICILNNIYHIQLYFILYIFLDIHIHHICHSVLCAISKCFLYFSTHVNFISPTSHPTFSAFFFLSFMLSCNIGCSYLVL